MRCRRSLDFFRVIVLWPHAIVTPVIVACNSWCGCQYTACAFAIVRALAAPVPVLYSQFFTRASITHGSPHYVPAQATPDWLGQDKNDVALGAPAKQKWREEVGRWFSAQAKRQAKPKLMQKKLANKWWVNALDAAIKAGLGIELQSMIVTNPPRALKPCERRFDVLVSTLSPELQLASLGRAIRCCIGNTETGKSWLECSWSSRRVILLLFTDMGSIGFPSFYWLFCFLKARGWFFPDHAHRRSDNHLNAYTDAHLKFIKTEMLLLASCGSAPYKGAGHFGVIQEAAAEYFCSHGITAPL